jgi:hypothetical protein
VLTMRRVVGTKGGGAGALELVVGPMTEFEFLFKHADGQAVTKLEELKHKVSSSFAGTSSFWQLYIGTAIETVSYLRDQSTWAERCEILLLKKREGMDDMTIFARETVDKEHETDLAARCADRSKIDADLKLQTTPTELRAAMKMASGGSSRSTMKAGKKSKTPPSKLSRARSRVSDSDEDELLGDMAQKVASGATGEVADECPKLTNMRTLLKSAEDKLLKEPKLQIDGKGGGGPAFALFYKPSLWMDLQVRLEIQGLSPLT